MIFKALPPLLAGILALPLLGLFWEAASPHWETWTFLWETRLFELTQNSFLLAMLTGGLSLGLGTGLAWWVSAYEFPLRRTLEWALLLPMAMPAYVIGLAYRTSFEYQGPLAALLEPWGWSLELRGLGWVSLMLALVLYPYVYLMARSGFQSQSQLLMEAALSLGVKRGQLFWRVALPMARPAIMVGLALALMETLADFGTVGLFGFDTFTTAIYEVWYGLYDKQAATQLALLLLLFALALYWLELLTRGQKEYFTPPKGLTPLQRLRPRLPWAMTLACLGVLTLAFFYPAGVLAYWAMGHLEKLGEAATWGYLGNTLGLGFLAVAVILPMALLIAYAKRLVPSWSNRFWARLASLGYALPGSVVAVGCLIPLAALDHWLNGWTLRLWGLEVGLLFTGGVVGLLLAYGVRFFSLGYNAVETSLARITPSMDMAARSLGVGPKAAFWRVHLALLRPGLWSGALLILVDVMKEMPATLLMRPFGFDSLATRIWQMASESMAEEAAFYSLFIILAGLIPVILLIRLSQRR